MTFNYDRIDDSLLITIEEDCIRISQLVGHVWTSEISKESYESLWSSIKSKISSTYVSSTIRYGTSRYELILYKSGGYSIGLGDTYYNGNQSRVGTYRFTKSILSLIEGSFGA